MPTYFTKAMMIFSLLLSAAIFGFFYAWVCSTMWGLDAADPRVAIAAMQAMNASVRNAVFAPAFFGTPIALLITAALLWSQNIRRSAALFGAGGVVYFAFGMVLTMAVNVPMNEALGALDVPQDIAEARDIWLAYSPDWQIWNITRTITSGLAFTLALLGVFALPSSA
ncbi:anthrone oxygenase family protein [uncultured Sulfitobacter sp.]|uniref:anthrone oxygenase family protein n=1 Tax=uncultured Sulfitobacter sp. TaxID=191468 RepID=UPI0026343BD1|nr:anthrone oxygenase family protein [uncultured Sulfitobacter sp.]